MIGKTILHYEILAKLGEGGMGTVYKAHDTKLKREVAIKFLSGKTISDEERERFKTEAQAAAALNLNHIATIHNIEEFDGELFIVMEYIEGRELKAVIVQHPDGLPVETAMQFALQIADGLAAAHDKGIVHRDIKSANIMLTARDQIKIMDFGLAKVSGGAQVTKVGPTLGTAAYMSPEQAKGEEVDRRADIWAFGVLLYEMLTGAFPFGGDYEQAVMYAVLNEEPDYPDRIPDHFKTILAKALAKDKTTRYQHISDLAADLHKPGGMGAAPGRSADAAKGPPGRRNAWLFGGTFLFLVVLAAFFLWPRGPENRAIDSIAVLPFENLSGDAEQDYFSDGMTGALITDLSKISALKVISRTSVMHYKGTSKTQAAIAEELGVAALLEGAVMRAGKRVRITTELIEAATSRVLWAQAYERDLTDIFALQSDIAWNVANEIQITLTQSEQRQLQQKKRQIDPEAYEAYLKGLMLNDLYTGAGLKEAMSMFKRAVEIEPDFVLAHVGIAKACVGMIDIGPLTFDEAYQESKDALDRALQLNDSLDEVHVALGGFRHIAEWNWKGAEAAYQKALALNPNNANAYHDYGTLLLCLDRGQEALDLIHKARSLDPLSPDINNDMGWFHFVLRQYEDAVREYRHTLDLYPDYVMSHRELSWPLAKLGQSDEAIATAKKAIALDPNDNVTLAQLALVYAVAGQKDEALRVTTDILAGRVSDRLPLYELATIYATLGDLDVAYDYLERSYQEHSGWPFFIKVDPFADPLRDDPRYAPFLRRMGLEP